MNELFWLKLFLHGHLSSKCPQVVSGDLICDVSPGAVAAAHRRHDAVVTALLCSTPVSGASEAGSMGGKEKAKKPVRYNIIGLDPSKQFLLYIASGLQLNYIFMLCYFHHTFSLYVCIIYTQSSQQEQMLIKT